MGGNLYANLGYAVVLCVKYIFVPLGVAVSARIIADRLLQPLPRRQRKKRSHKSRF